MADCIFCRIAKGEIPSFKVYEDAHSFAFLDVNPLTAGHTLVIPKGHFGRLEDMAPTAQATLLSCIARLVPAVQTGSGSPSTNVAFNNGPEAGQEVPHVHCHIIPRHAGDGGGPVHAIVPPSARPKLSKEDFARLGEAIKSRIK